MNAPQEELRVLVERGPIHFMGIGGAGMCALAEAIVRAGGEVTGCDHAFGGSVEPLRTLGVRLLAGHDPAHVEGAAALVRTSAIPETHPELRAALERGIPILRRAEALGSWVNPGTVVAVAGTHGKTTTTAMATAILVEAGRDPS